MIALLVSAFLLGAAQAPQKSLYREVVTTPTGNNGYEEYLMACDIVKDTGVAWLTDATPQNFEAVIREYEEPVPEGAVVSYKTEKPNVAAYQRAKKYRNYTVLQLRREAVSIAGKALDLLNKGNKKPVFDPRTKTDISTLFPEFAQMKALSKLAVAGAYVAFADGQPNKGTQYLCDAIILGHNLSDGVLISRLVGVAVQSIAFAAFEKYLPSLSGKDAAYLEALAPRLIQTPPGAVKSLTKEFQFMDSNLEAIFQEPETMLSGMDDEQSATEKSATELIKKLGPADRQRVVEMCKKEIVRIRETLLASYKRPESQWDLPVDTGDGGFDGKRTVNNINELAACIGEALTPVFSQVGVTEIKNRTQIRLLGLAGSVIRYKWDNDRWPAKLSDAVGEKGVFDPVSGEEFQYLVEANGFKVFSKGTKNTGEIALKYRRPEAGQDVAPPPLP